MNTKVEEALANMTARAEAAEKHVAAADTKLAALSQHIAQQDATIARMREALADARGYVVNVRDTEKRTIANPEHTSSSVIQCEATLAAIDAALKGEGK